MIDLASSRYGGEVVWCSDEFFAAASNLVRPSPPVWREGEFTEHGKWMDGWETRRRRDDGHDACVVRLGLPGSVHSVAVDTTHFTGNYPESFSLDVCGVPGDRLDEAEWAEILPRTPLAGDSVSVFEVGDRRRVTHIRLNIYPDGGVARLRVHGDSIPAPSAVCPDRGTVDLALATLGGRCVAASDAHFSSPANLVSPTEPDGMWDGWETARRRGPGRDWAEVVLGLTGTVHAVDVDTRYFKGNAPGWVEIEASLGESGWKVICDRVAVRADHVNRIEVMEPQEADRIRLNIHPDGGVARLRVWGRPTPQEAASAGVRYLNALFGAEARDLFSTACASGRWIEEMLERRPFADARSLLDSTEEAFGRLESDDWLEAFAAHPRIGERRGGQNAGGEAMSHSEQEGVDDRDELLAEELAEANRLYEERFGYTFIVRAAGRSGKEMLDLARNRLQHEPEAELEVAAVQQREITRLRLGRLLCLEEEEN